MQVKNLPIEQGQWPDLRDGLHNCPLIIEAVEYLHNRVQAHREMCLLAILSAIATAQQGLINVEQIHGGFTPSSLWIWITAKSGERKTALMKMALKVIYEHQRKHRKKYVEELKDYEKQCEIYNNKRKHLMKEHRKALASGDNDAIEIAALDLSDLKNEKPQRPISRDVVFEDIMPEALQWEFFRGLGNAALISSEGGTILGGPVVRNLAFLSSAWSNESYYVHRKSSTSFVLEDIRLTFALAAQPVALDKFISKKGEEAKGIGLFARCIYCNAISTQGYRTETPNKSTYEEGGKRYNDRLSEIMNTYEERMIEENGERHLVEFEEDCKPRAWEIYMKIENELKEGGMYEYVTEHASKLFENITRVAGNLTYFEKGEGAKISYAILHDAAKICFHFSRDYLEYFQPQPDYIEDAKVLFEYFVAQQEYGKRYVAKTPLRRSGPYRLRNMDRLNRALENLANEGYIQVWRIAKSGFTFIDLYPNLPDDMSQWQPFCQQHKISEQLWYHLWDGKVLELPTPKSHWA